MEVRMSSKVKLSLSALVLFSQFSYAMTLVCGINRNGQHKKFEWSSTNEVSDTGTTSIDWSEGNNMGVKSFGGSFTANARGQDVLRASLYMKNGSYVDANSNND